MQNYLQSLINYLNVSGICSEQSTHGQFFLREASALNPRSQLAHCKAGTCTKLYSVMRKPILIS